MKHEKSILRSKFRLLKKIQKFVLGVLGGRKHSTGSRKWFGTTLDYLRWIRSHLRRIEKIMSETSFWSYFCNEKCLRNAFVSLWSRICSTRFSVRILALNSLVSHQTIFIMLSDKVMWSDSWISTFWERFSLVLAKHFWAPNKIRKL